MKELDDKLAELGAKQSQLKTLVDEMQGSDGALAFANIKSVTDGKGEIDRLAAEVKATEAEYHALKSTNDAIKVFQEGQAALDRPVSRPPLGKGDGGDTPAAAKTMGRLFVESGTIKGLHGWTVPLRPDQ